MDWRYSQSCWYFRPLLWTSAPLNFSLVHLPQPVSTSAGVCIYSVCNRGGGGSGCVECIYRSYTLCIWPDSEPTKLLYHLKQKPKEGREPQTDKHLPPSPFKGQFLRKANIWDWILLVIWSFFCFRPPAPTIPFGCLHLNYPFEDRVRASNLRPNQKSLTRE